MPVPAHGEFDKAWVDAFVRGLTGGRAGGWSGGRAEPNRYAVAVEACGGVDKIEALSRYAACNLTDTPPATSLIRRLQPH
jgi:hypothetical protein